MVALDTKGSRFDVEVEQSVVAEIPKEGIYVNTNGSFGWLGRSTCRTCVTGCNRGLFSGSYNNQISGDPDIVLRVIIKEQAPTLVNDELSGSGSLQWRFR